MLIITLYIVSYQRSHAQEENPFDSLRSSVYSAASEQFLEVQNVIRSRSFLWCGFRDSAPYLSAVSAVYPNLDSCCRNHDNCPLIVDRGECHEEDSTICNDSFLFPILDCKCEARFKHCLKQVIKSESGSSVSERFLSDTIDVGYFGVIP